MNFGDFSIHHYFGWERPKVSVALKRQRYLQLELLRALPPIPLLRSYHRDWLIEIQFTRPCSLECLSRRTGLVTFWTCKQMPALPGQNYFNIGYWVIIVKSPWRSVMVGDEESLLCNWCFLPVFPAALQLQWSTLVVDKFLIEWYVSKTKQNTIWSHKGGKNYLYIKIILG